MEHRRENRYKMRAILFHRIQLVFVMAFYIVIHMLCRVESSVYWCLNIIIMIILIITVIMIIIVTIMVAIIIMAIMIIDK